MDYCTFERIFARYCTKGFCVDFGVNEIEQKFTLNPTNENIDRYILLPAGFSEEDMNRYLGEELSVLDKSLLSKMRNGNSIRGYFKTIYSNDEAIARTTAHFKKYIPRVMLYGARESLVIDLLSENEKIQYSDLNVRVLTDDAYFFDFLARVFSSCFSGIPFNMNEYCRRLDSNSWLVDRAISDLREMGLCQSVMNLIDIMYENRQLELDSAILGVVPTKEEIQKEQSNMRFSTDEMYRFCRALLLQKDYIEGDYRKKVYELTSLSFCAKIRELIFLEKHKEALFELLEILYDVLNSAASLCYDAKRQNNVYPEDIVGLDTELGIHLLKYDHDNIVVEILANMVDNIFGVDDEVEAIFESPLKKDLLKRASHFGVMKRIKYFELLQCEYLKIERDIKRMIKEEGIEYPKHDKRNKRHKHHK